MAYSVIAQDEEMLHDMEEYTELMEQVQASEKSPSPDTVETVIPAITVAPYPSGSAKPTEYPLDILPGEQYWAAVERADKESADYIPENNVGAIIVIIPGTDAEAGKQEQQTARDYQGNNLLHNCSPFKYQSSTIAGASIILPNRS